MLVWTDKELSDESTDESPFTPGSSDDYEIEKKYELVCRRYTED